MAYFELCIVNTSIIKVYGDKFWQFPRLKCTCKGDPTIIKCTTDDQNEQIFKDKMRNIIIDYNGTVQAKIDHTTNNIVNTYLKNEENKLHINIATVLIAIIKRYTRISIQNIQNDLYNCHLSPVGHDILTDVDDSDLDVSMNDQ